jgi:hypothetical protein
MYLAPCIRTSSSTSPTGGPPSLWLQTWLGFLIMALLAIYHYVTADTKFEQQEHQQ